MSHLKSSAGGLCLTEGLIPAPQLPYFPTHKMKSSNPNPSRKQGKCCAQMTTIPFLSIRTSTSIFLSFSIAFVFASIVDRDDAMSCNLTIEKTLTDNP